MFAADGDTIPSDTSTRDYIAAMPGVANEALQMLATAGKFIVKTIKIAHNPVNNLLYGGEHIQKMERGTMSYEAEGARSLYFEYFGKGTYTVSVDGVEVINDTLSSGNGYASIKKLIPNEEDKKVVLQFHSNYPFAIKNFALYSADFETEDEVQSFAEKIRYPLREYADDFYMLDTENIYYEGDVDITRYIQTSDYFQEGNTVLVLDRNIPGDYTIYYKAYPQTIDQSTTDDTELSVDPEVAALMPLYMASQLYKDDDAGIATTYRNEFEVAFSRLRDNVNTPSAERFTSESGWI